MTRRIYISGPVTGMPLRNVGEFERAASALELAGYQASVPTRFVAAGTPHEAAMRTCIAELLRCDGVCVLDGWQSSKGANVELDVAIACGIEWGELAHWVMSLGSGAR